MLSWEDYYKDEAPVKKDEKKSPEPRVAEVTGTENTQAVENTQEVKVQTPDTDTLVTEDMNSEAMQELPVGRRAHKGSINAHGHLPRIDKVHCGADGVLLEDDLASLE